MSSDIDDIIKGFKGYQKELDEAIYFYSSENPQLTKEEIGINRRFANQDKIMKEVFYHLERLFRISNSHRLQIMELYESIMSLPEVKADQELHQKIKDRFEAVKEKNS
jgi:hypothetical protein